MHTDDLETRYAALAEALPKVTLCDLPTPVDEHRLRHARQTTSIWVKRDDLSGTLYGGNKVRKLEYLLGRVLERRCKRVATFGAIASNHALATALYARQLELEPVCFLSHQTRTPLAAQALTTHLDNHSNLVPYRGNYSTRVQTLRAHLWNRQTGVIPLGGSSWLGTVGFVNAGLELAQQIGDGQLPRPDRIYMAAGTLGSVTGLAIGLALAAEPAEVHAVRVSHQTIANESVLQRLLHKTIAMLSARCADFPTDVRERVNIVWRHDYFAPGYAHSNEKTELAIDVAARDLGLRLEPTYTGKAFAALMDDVENASNRRPLFWNTYHPGPTAASPTSPADRRALPDEFLSYFDSR